MDPKKIAIPIEITELLEKLTAPRQMAFEMHAVKHSYDHMKMLSQQEFDEDGEAFNEICSRLGQEMDKRRLDSMDQGVMITVLLVADALVDMVIRLSAVAMGENYDDLPDNMAIDVNSHALYLTMTALGALGARNLEDKMPELLNEVVEHEEVCETEHDLKDQVEGFPRGMTSSGLFVVSREKK